jgi:EAL domain-containing protein (putative c-di-GMP-specific phosphodiesterase class I)
MQIGIRNKSFIGKIDRPETAAVLASIVQLARNLKLSNVAEGIDTTEQLERARALGIDFG